MSRQERGEQYVSRLEISSVVEEIDPKGDMEAERIPFVCECELESRLRGLCALPFRPGIGFRKAKSSSGRVARNKWVLHRVGQRLAVK